MNTSFFLQAEGHSADNTGDQSPIHRYSSSSDETDKQSDSDSRSIREHNSQDSDDDHDSDNDRNSDDDHNSQLDRNSLYSNCDESSCECQSTSLKHKLPEEVQAAPEKPKAVLYFSSVYYNVTDTNERRTYSTAQSSVENLMTPQCNYMVQLTQAMTKD